MEITQGESEETMRALARKEGIFAGVSAEWDEGQGCMCDDHQ